MPYIREHRYALPKCGVDKEPYAGGVHEQMTEVATLNALAAPSHVTAPRMTRPGNMQATCCYVSGSRGMHIRLSGADVSIAAWTSERQMDG
jgi:hypothetical protein